MTEKDGRLWVEPEIADLVLAVFRLGVLIGDSLEECGDVAYETLGRLGFTCEYAGWLPKRREGATLFVVLRERYSPKKPYWGVYVRQVSARGRFEVTLDRVRYEDEKPFDEEVSDAKDEG